MRRSCSVSSWAPPPRSSPSRCDFPPEASRSWGLPGRFRVIPAQNIWHSRFCFFLFCQCVWASFLVGLPGWSRALAALIGSSQLVAKAPPSTACPGYACHACLAFRPWFFCFLVPEVAQVRPHSGWLSLSPSWRLSWTCQHHHGRSSWHGSCFANGGWLLLFHAEVCLRSTCLLHDLGLGNLFLSVCWRSFLDSVLSADPTRMWQWQNMGDFSGLFGFANSFLRVAAIWWLRFQHGENYGTACNRTAMGVSGVLLALVVGRGED